MKRLDQPATGELDNEELIVAGRAQERRQPGTASTERHGGRRTSFKVLTVVRSLRKRRQRKRRKWHVAKTRVVTLSAFRGLGVAVPWLRTARSLVGREQGVGEYVRHRPYMVS